ncbi:MAG: HAMP domain-containing protein [Candidatus Methylomirabilales bacterium]
MSRRLSLAAASLFSLVLVVGGISILLAYWILESTDQIETLSEEIKGIDQIHFTAHHLVDTISYAATRGRPDAGDDLPHIISNLSGQVQAYLTYLKTNKGLLEEELEFEIFQELMGTASDLGRVSERIFGAVTRGNQAKAGDLQSLLGLIRRIHRRAEQLTHIHQAKIRQLVQSSEAKMRLILLFYLAFVLVGGLLIVMGSYFFSRAIVAPLRTLATATQEVAGGHFKKRVSVSSNDEIGQLSHAFNVMAEKLEQHEEQLTSLNESLEHKVREAEALYKIGTEILGLLDLDKVLHSVVEKAKDLLGCEIGALCLLDDEKDELVPRVTSGPAEAFGKGRSKRVDRDLAVAPTAHCPPAQGAGGQGRSLFRCAMVKPEYLEAHLTVPLKRGEKVIGVFCVGDRRPREFSAAEVDLLAGLATQAAIAIENAKLYERTQGLAILEERERIAREMHDGLAQALGAMHFRISRAQELLKGPQTARVQNALEEIRKMAEGAYEEIRQAIFGLRTMVSRTLGLVPTLTEYLHEWSLQNGVAADLEIANKKAINLSPEAELQLIRIIQEALANVRKHAAARHARVRFELDGDHLLVTVADDGRGFDLAELPRRTSQSFGFETMRERAESVAGSLQVQSQPGRGTSVVVRLPFSGDGRL